MKNINKQKALINTLKVSVASLIVFYGIQTGQLNNLEQHNANNNPTTDRELVAAADWLKQNKDNILLTAMNDNEKLKNSLEKCNETEFKVLNSQYINDGAKKQLLNANKINKRKAIDEFILKKFFNFSDKQVKEEHTYNKTHSFFLNDDNFNSKGIALERVNKLKKVKNKGDNKYKLNSLKKCLKI